MIDLFTVTVALTTGQTHVYRGVVLLHRDSSLNLLTVDFLDPADWRDGDGELQHVAGFPYSAMLWWTERATPDAVPYIILPPDTGDAATREPGRDLS